MDCCLRMYQSQPHWSLKWVIEIKVNEQLMTTVIMNSLWSLMGLNLNRSITEYKRPPVICGANRTHQHITCPILTWFPVFVTYSFVIQLCMQFNPRYVHTVR